jgi:hypothetical protein
MTATRAATVWLAAVACVAASWRAAALSTGGPGGTWPATWPKELEPLRKQAWTWEHADSRAKSYDIPFADRAQFEAAWPHVLAAAALDKRGMSVTLVRGPRLRVGANAKPTAGVQIFLPGTWATTRPASLTHVFLVVDGDVVDLNRIPLPQGTTITDERFKDDPATPKPADSAGDKTPPAEPKPATPGK